MSTLEICPVCCEGSLHPYFFSKELKHKNVTCHASAFEASRCNVCGTSVANAEQTKRNKLMAAEEQRRAISSVKEEIYIPVPPPAAEIECNPVVTIVKNFRRKKNE